MKEAGIITKLAWRNVWRNKRRTILTLLTIVVGCGMIIFMNSLAKGGHDQMIEDAIIINTGHIQIHEKGFWDNQTIDYAFQTKRPLRKAIESDKRISGYSFRIHAGCLLSFEGNTSGAVVQGVDPKLETKVSNIHKKIISGGRYLIPGDTTHIVIGETLAKNIGAKAGSIISMISQGFDGSIAAERLTVVGLFRTGNPEYDRTLLIMPLAQARETFTMMSYIHSVTIRLTESEHTKAVKNSLSSTVQTDKIEVMGWDELMPELVQFIVMDDVSAYIFDLILFLVVAFGILNTIQMSVFERTREFGIMLSIGTRPGQVVKMILVESIVISLMGIFLGIAVGCSISY
ncbi:MAG: ABC transporter permease, partial [Candidatus Omnitrophica bacterium]|nr:ABC transporter permease [Candidatus Omnitrophota bacterium]